jgi:hypothetical protein
LHKIESDEASRDADADGGHELNGTQLAPVVVVFCQIDAFQRAR